MKRRARIACLAASAIAVASLGTAVVFAALDPMPRVRALEYSTVVLDRNGRLLRPYPISEGRWRLRTTVADIDPRYLKQLLAYEDKRFYQHRGVDLLALGRAAWQWLRYGHVVSGGSTLTMQVARLLDPRNERTISVKLKEIVRAIELERALTKREIIDLYLSLAPFGGNLEGVRAASLAYFGKEPARLTPGQAALLVALPQSPEARRPDRFAPAARRARERVLDRLAAARLMPADEIAQARAEPMPGARKAMPVLAPHAADEAVAVAPSLKTLQLTIDAALQARLETLAGERAHALGPNISVAIVAVDNGSAEMLAHVGSANYFDDRSAGQVDMARALRSPGSTLKPFIYGLGLEDGLIHPETLIDDRPVRYGGYAPENFDQTFQGTVTVRRALQLSLNVPAVAVLDKVGASRLRARLMQAGASLVLPEGDSPGLAMGLGGVGISLTDLTMLYTGLARLGTAMPLVENAAAPAESRRRLLDAVAAWYIGNVLLGTPPPENAPQGRIAYKTGTSYGYRDAWAVGFDGKLTIGVWVGRPDGAPVPGMIGRGAAAPILFDAFARSGIAPARLPPAPKGVITATNAGLPPPLQHFGGEGNMAANAEKRPHVMFPPNGVRLELTRSKEGGFDPVPVKVTGNGPLTVLADGVPLASNTGKRTLFFSPQGPGFVRLTVTDSRGAADSVTVRVQ
ncbi:MAG TPA: penicillin-binding protein 1C [Xanthobacteraceae bacterium]|nr:penicillin-binding protein 1C [Xanthobacteraceae bacterium]